MSEERTRLDILRDAVLDDDGGPWEPQHVQGLFPGVTLRLSVVYDLLEQLENEGLLKHQGGVFFPPPCH